MTDTPHLEALAMRTRAADHCQKVSADCKEYNLPQAAGMVASVGREILALPLEADPAALVTEALKLPQIVALRDALEPFAKYMIAEDGRMDRDAIGLPIPDKQGVGWIYLTYQDFRRAEAALTALEQP